MNDIVQTVPGYTDRYLLRQDAKAAELQRFQIAHHMRTGEVLTPDQARPLLAREREVQLRAAYHDMVRRLAHARRLQGASRAEFVEEDVCANS